MSTVSISDEEVSLWDCLHDGRLESLVSDTLARSVNIAVDVPYLWSFHSLPSSTRFHLILQGSQDRGSSEVCVVAWGTRHTRRYALGRVGRNQESGLREGAVRVD